MENQIFLFSTGFLNRLVEFIGRNVISQQMSEAGLKCLY